MKKLSFIFATVIISLMISCDRNERDEVVKEPENKIKAIHADNPMNPYDYYGKLHNKALKITLSELSGKKDISFNECISTSFAVTNKVLKDEKSNYYKVKSNSSEINEELINSLGYLMEDLDNNFENFIVSLNLDPHTKSKLDVFFRNIISMSEH